MEHVHSEDVSSDFLGETDATGVKPGKKWIPVSTLSTVAKSVLGPANWKLSPEAAAALQVATQEFLGKLVRQAISSRSKKGSAGALRPEEIIAGLGTRKAVPEATPKSGERVVLGDEGYAAHIATLRKELAAKRQAKKARKRKGTVSDPAELERLQKEQQRLFREARERREAAANYYPGFLGGSSSN